MPALAAIIERFAADPLLRCGRPKPDIGVRGALLRRRLARDTLAVWRDWPDSLRRDYAFTFALYSYLQPFRTLGRSLGAIGQLDADAVARSRS